MTYSEFKIIAESSHGHVSNVKLFEYLDQARKEWYYFCILIGVEAVVVHISTDYKREVFDDERLYIRTWISRIGNTSFTLRQTIVNEGNELVVSAEVVLTTINRQTREKMIVPHDFRSLLDKDSVLDYKHLVS